MAEQTKIEWTGTWYDNDVMWKDGPTRFIPGATFNLVIGCQKVSPACKFCYAEIFDKRYKKGEHWGPGTERITMSQKYWNEPLKWNAECLHYGVRRKVFCSSLADWAEDHPTVQAQRKRLFELIKATPQLIWLLLTKRMDEDIMSKLPDDWGPDGYENVWLGTTIEDQEWLNKRIPHLLNTPARVHFVSAEPLLGYADFTKVNVNGINLNSLSEFSQFKYHIDQIIVGGESGRDKGIRPMHPNWVKHILLQCKMTDTNFFFKQWGEYTPYNIWEALNLKVATEMSDGFGDTCTFYRVGKKHSGRVLETGEEGSDLHQIKEYNEMPTI